MAGGGLRLAAAGVWGGCWRGWMLAGVDGCRWCVVCKRARVDECCWKEAHAGTSARAVVQRGRSSERRCLQQRAPGRRCLQLGASLWLVHPTEQLGGCIWGRCHARRGAGGIQVGSTEQLFRQGRSGGAPASGGEFASFARARPAAKPSSSGWGGYAPAPSGRYVAVSRRGVACCSGL